MQPSRPPTNNPNASYRATTPTLIDFFANEREEQQESTAMICQQSQFVELSPRGASYSNNLTAIADADPSSTSSNVTVSTLRSFLSSKGHSVGHRMYDTTIQNRLIRANLSAETLLATFEIIFTPHHPILERLGVSEIRRYFLISRLSGIVNRSVGFNIEIETAARRANNNPQLLIESILSLDNQRHHS